MKIEKRQTFPGIEDTILVLTAEEKAALERASKILRAARERVGTESYHGEELGKADAFLSQYLAREIEIDSRTLDADEAADAIEEVLTGAPAEGLLRKGESS